MLFTLSRRAATSLARSAWGADTGAATVGYARSQASEAGQLAAGRQPLRRQGVRRHRRIPIGGADTHHRHQVETEMAQRRREAAVRTGAGRGPDRIAPDEDIRCRARVAVD